MVDGKMVSTNPTIYLNTHGEMVKTPLINGDRVKAKLNISLPKSKSNHLVLPDSSQILCNKGECENMVPSNSHT